MHRLQRQRKLIPGSIMLASLLLVFGAPAAQASAIYTIDEPNTGLASYLGPYATVTVDLLSPTSAAVTFESLTATSGNTNCTAADPCTYLMGGNAAAALNVNGTFALSTILPTGYSFSGAQNVSEFGDFNLTIDGPDGFPSATSLISFNLANTGGSWSGADNVLIANNKDNVAAAHIFVASDDCDGACVTGYASTPEPGTMALLGIGLLMICGTLHKFTSRAR